MKDVLISLIRFGVCENCNIENLDEVKNNLPVIFRLAKRHDMAQIVAHSAKKLGINSPLLDKEIGLSVLRYEKMNYAKELLCEILESAEIPYFILKGEHIRPLYPEAWMRNSSDVDAFVDEKDLERAHEALEKAGFVKGRTGSHDTGFEAPNGYKIELHWLLIEKDRHEGAWNILKSPWDNAVQLTEYRWALCDEAFYLYHLAHMVKHIQNGGCGIKPFVDLWLLREKLADNPKRHELCKRAGLDKFEETSVALADAWFSGEEFTPMSRSFERYVLTGNVYGSSHNLVAFNQRTTGNMMIYALKRLFMPYSILKKRYPALKSKPYLFPYYTVCRWLSIFKKDTSVRIKDEVGVSKEELNSLNSLFNELGL